MGMAPGKASRPTILEDLFGDRGHVNTAVFSMCLAEWGGRLTVGGYNSSYHERSGNKSSQNTSDIVWVPMQLGSYYHVALERVEVNGQIVAASKVALGRTIVDSGTTYTYFPSRVY